MKIKDYKQKPLDVTEMLIGFKKNYRNVYMQTIDDQLYFYRSINRNEYKSLFENDKLSDLDKEDIVCNMCVLYPEDIDFNNCEAGLPTTLYNLIIENSFLTKEGRRNVMNYYRNDMANIDNQMTCIIHEAFQNIDIEEIESWDMEKTLKYISRSEWILHNLRGVPLREDKGNPALDNAPEPIIHTDPLSYDLPEETGQEDNKEKETNKIEDKSNELNHKGNKKTPLTEEKLRELENKFPQIDWRHDEGNKGLKGFALTADVPDVPYAMIPEATLIAKEKRRREILDQDKTGE